MIFKGILLGIAAFVAVLIVKPPTGDADVMGCAWAAIVGVLVAVAVAVPD